MRATTVLCTFAKEILYCKIHFCVAVYRLKTGIYGYQQLWIHRTRKEFPATCSYLVPAVYTPRNLKRNPRNFVVCKIQQLSLKISRTEGFNWFVWNGFHNCNRFFLVVGKDFWVVYSSKESMQYFQSKAQNLSQFSLFKNVFIFDEWVFWIKSNIYDEAFLRK